MRRTVALVVFLHLLGACCGAEQHLRIGVFRRHQPDSVRVFCDAGLRFVLASSDSLLLRPSESVEITASSDGLTIRMPTVFRHGVPSILLRPRNGRPVRITSSVSSGVFSGALHLSARRGRLLIVNTVPLEDYVCGVLPNEMNAYWCPEALKAQAVVARTLAVSRLGSHAREGFDLCDSTHCQVYRGIAGRNGRTDSAVRATAGRILLRGGKPIRALYCSTCGGVASSTLARGSKGGYPGVLKDIIGGAPACSASPHFNWARRIGGRDLARALGADRRTACGAAVDSVEVISRDASGRAAVVRVRGDREIDADAYVFWNVVCRRLGWNTIKSTLFSVRRSEGGFEFRGRGLGHGVGLCQWGARKRAEAGWSWERIVRFYYPDSEVGRIRWQNRNLAVTAGGVWR